MNLKDAVTTFLQYAMAVAGVFAATLCIMVVYFPETTHTIFYGENNAVETISVVRPGSGILPTDEQHMAAVEFSEDIGRVENLVRKDDRATYADATRKIPSAVETGLVDADTSR